MGLEIISFAILAFVFCALWGGKIADFLFKALMITILGCACGAIGGAVAYALLHHSIGDASFGIGVIVGIVIYICLWLWR